MTYRPQPEREDILSELDPEELAAYYRQRDRQPRANRTPHHREDPAAYTWEPTEADTEAGRES